MGDLGRVLGCLGAALGVLLGDLGATGDDFGSISDRLGSIWVGVLIVLRVIFVLFWFDFPSQLGSKKPFKSIKHR